MSVVLFNKFVLGKKIVEFSCLFLLISIIKSGKVYHLIVDTELISTKSKFNITFAQKLAFALFMNTAMIS
jgi:hypothetical protein